MINRAPAAAPSRLASSSDVPGFSISDTTSEPSLKAGRNARGKNGTLATAIATSAATVQTSGRARGNDQASSFSSLRFSHATSGLSPWSMRFMVGSR